MRRPLIFWLVLGAWLGIPISLVALDSPQKNRWPGFRGAGAGFESLQNLPLVWSEKENIAWHIKLPGYGQSSPVIWGDLAFVTAVQGPQKEFLLVAAVRLDRGKTVWQKQFPASQTAESTKMVARAAPTPAVDASGIYVFFGSGDLMKLSLAGDLIWSRKLTKEYGMFIGNHGVGSSPVLGKEALYLLVDHDGPSYLMAVNKKNGKNLWKKERAKRISWTTPVVAHSGKAEQLFISSNGRVEAVETATGSQLWFYDGVIKNTVASPVIAGSLVIVPSSKTGGMLALPLDGKKRSGQINPVWQGGWPSSFSSPAVVDGTIYAVNKAGVVACMALETGAVLWRHRLPETCWASPVVAKGAIYFFSKNGETSVLAPDKSTAVKLAVNQLPLAPEETVYGVAAARGLFLVRTGTQLIKVGQP